MKNHWKNNAIVQKKTAQIEAEASTIMSEKDQKRKKVEEKKDEQETSREEIKDQTHEEEDIEEEDQYQEDWNSDKTD